MCKSVEDTYNNILMGNTHYDHFFWFYTHKLDKNFEIDIEIKTIYIESVTNGTGLKKNIIQHKTTTDIAFILF